jgi:hypothetical protein
LRGRAADDGKTTTTNKGRTRNRINRFRLPISKHNDRGAAAHQRRTHQEVGGGEAALEDAGRCLFVILAHPTQYLSDKSRRRPIMRLIDVISVGSTPPRSLVRPTLYGAINWQSAYATRTGTGRGHEPGRLEPSWPPPSKPQRYMIVPDDRPARVLTEAGPN